jgi:hypothetical protein
MAHARTGLSLGSVETEIHLVPAGNDDRGDGPHAGDVVLDFMWQERPQGRDTLNFWSVEGAAQFIEKRFA